CRLKLLKRREICVSAFWSYCTFSVLVSRYPRSARIDERCACSRYEDILLSLVLGGLCYISVSSPSFFIIKCSFTMYSSRI
ncbi:hypothetical protein K443DRAFT_101755, partial [Laccaria amethystina LaAM-08-1]